VSALLIGGLVAARGFSADAGVQIATSLGPGSELWLEGKSTLHDFESRTSETTLTLARDPAATAPADLEAFAQLIRSGALRTVELGVPVKSLKSDKSGLDKNLWKYLKSDAHPMIRFRLLRYTVAPAGAVGDTMQIHAEGTLEVAGIRRPDTLEARAYRAAQGVWLEGNEPLLMSQFGIRPPSMMLGTLRVADRIVVRYRLLLVSNSESSASLQAMPDR